MVIASVQGTTLEGVLGKVSSGWRTDAYGVVFPSGFPLVQVFKDGSVENIAERQLSRVYRLDVPSRVANLLGVAVQVEKLPGYSYPWQVTCLVSGKPIVRLVPVTICGRAYCNSVELLLPILGKK